MKDTLLGLGFIAMVAASMYGATLYMLTDEEELQRICTDFYDDSKLLKVGTSATSDSYICIKGDKILNTSLSKYSDYTFEKASNRCYKKEAPLANLAIWSDSYACISRDKILLWTMKK